MERRHRPTAVSTWARSSSFESQEAASSVCSGHAKRANGSSSRISRSIRSLHLDDDAVVVAEANSIRFVARLKNLGRQFAQSSGQRTAIERRRLDRKMADRRTLSVRNLLQAD